jgi:hypothetical protein
LLVLSCSNNEEKIQKEEKVQNEHKMQAAEEKSELVREGIIDVAGLDVNKDGKVYECPMDWNVIGDEHGDCPVCGMELKEYSLDDAKANLDKYGYEYKK